MMPAQNENSELRAGELNPGRTELPLKVMHQVIQEIGKK